MRVQDREKETEKVRERQKDKWIESEREKHTQITGEK